MIAAIAGKKKPSAIVAIIWKPLSSDRCEMLWSLRWLKSGFHMIITIAERSYRSYGNQHLQKSRTMCTYVLCSLLWAERLPVPSPTRLLTRALNWWSSTSLTRTTSLHHPYKWTNKQTNNEWKQNWKNEQCVNKHLQWLKLCLRSQTFTYFVFSYDKKRQNRATFLKQRTSSLVNLLCLSDLDETDGWSRLL